MSTQIKRGRGLLYDIGPAQGVYEVDYAAYISVRTIDYNIRPPVTSTMVFIEISPLNTTALRNGIYKLEESGQFLYTLEKRDTSWHIL
jgi:hypothetical protein